MSELTWVGKGVFYLSQGELDRAKYFFENARRQRRNFPATLGEAAVSFHRGKYKEALKLFRWVDRESNLIERRRWFIPIALTLLAFHEGRKENIIDIVYIWGMVG